MPSASPCSIGVLDAKVVAHDFKGSDPATADLRQQALRNDPAQRFRKADADLLLLFLVEHTDDAVDRLAGVDRVQRAQDEVAGFCGGQADFDGFAIAHFADENHLRRLAQGGAQTRGKGTEVASHFTLVEGCLSLRMNEFDRIFQRDDVDGLCFVQFIQQRGQGRGFSRSGCAGDQDQVRSFPSPSCETQAACSAGRASECPLSVFEG